MCIGVLVGQGCMFVCVNSCMYGCLCLGLLVGQGCV